MLKRNWTKNQVHGQGYLEWQVFQENRLINCLHTFGYFPVEWMHCKVHHWRGATIMCEKLGQHLKERFVNLCSFLLFHSYTDWLTFFVAKMLRSFLETNKLHSFDRRNSMYLCFCALQPQQLTINRHFAVEQQQCTLWMIFLYSRLLVLFHFDIIYLFIS